ncbi:MAG: ribose-phosphate diphosphokinase [Pseudomonadota bacterium]
MPWDASPAQELAIELGIAFDVAAVDRFPDRETKLRIPAAGHVTILYATLNDPDWKLFPLLLTASALRDHGAGRIVLAAPYLSYMRQDKAFQTGEPVSQQVYAQVLSPWIDRIVTIEPHLHRIKSLSEAFATIESTSLSAEEGFVSMLGAHRNGKDRILIGPDAEAEAWTQAIAARSNLPYAVMSKVRSGDRKVSVSLPDAVDVSDKDVVLVDDVCSSGTTLRRAAELALARGCNRVDAMVAHALCTEEDLDGLRQSGIQRFQSIATVRHETNAVSAAGILADALRKEVKG